MEILKQPEQRSPVTYAQARSGQKESTWQRLAEITVGEASRLWIETLQNPHTKRAYAAGLKRLAEFGLIDPTQTLQGFAVKNHGSVLDAIKGIEKASETTKQARAALYAAFTGFLERQTGGLAQKASPVRSGTTKTFFKVRDKVNTPAMNRQQVKTFLAELRQMNNRDFLVAALALQGAKRISEVLSVTTEAIDWTQSQITFAQAKTAGYSKETVITFPAHIFSSLRAYIGDREGLVFVTRNGKPVLPTQLDRTFSKAGEKAEIGFRVSAHVMRATAITLYLEANFSDGEIQKVSGHASSAMLRAYDKSERAENASSKVNLV